MSEDDLIRAIESWFNSLPVYRESGGPARGTIASALVLLERLRDNPVFSLDHHRAQGKSQIQGVGKAAVTRILQRFGESRPFLKEAGRTNRGGPGDLDSLLTTLRQTRIVEMTPEQRGEALTALQQFLVDKVRDYHGRQRIRIVYSPSDSTWQNVAATLASAREAGKEGPVAQHLVGAKLALRFPKIRVGSESYSTADDQLGRLGDFQIGTTAFHVTVAPMSGVYEKCGRNLEDGYRVFLLVPDRLLQGTRQNAGAVAPGKITVESIESFVSQNIDELSTFDSEHLKNGFRRLLETYNERVQAAETDRSLMIDVPPNLQIDRP